MEEICFFLKGTEAELDAIFQKEFRYGIQEIYQSAKKEGLIQLKQAQFEAAIAGDRTMLTHLGKEYLGQGKDLPPDDMDKGVIILPPYKPLDGGDANGANVNE